MTESTNSPIDATALDYKEPVLENQTREETRLDGVWGFFPTVTAIPTWVPKKVGESIAFLRGGHKAYYYDSANSLWRLLIGGLSDDTSPSLVANLDANGFAITGLDDPTNAQDAATKAYVDAISVPNPGGTFARITTAATFNSDSISTTETDVLSTTMTGGTMGANGMIRYRMQISWPLASSASPACTIRFKIGSSNVMQLDFAQGDTTSRTYRGVCEAICQNANSQSAQISSGRGLLFVDGGGGTAPAQMIQHSNPTSSVDTSSNHDVKATIQFSGTGRGTITVHTCEFELVKVDGA